MVMKIYGAPTGNCTRAILPLFDAEVDVDKEVELVPVDIFKGDHKLPGFVAKNPLGIVPCLEDGDFILFESRAIARYIAEKYEHQGVPLLGSTLQSRAIINQWCEVEGQTLTPAQAPIFREVFHALLEKRPRNDELIDACIAKVAAIFDIYETRLATSKYLAGEDYTLADAFHIPHLHKLMDLRKDVFLGRSHVLAWAERLISRPAFQKALEKRAQWKKT